MRKSLLFSLLFAAVSMSAAEVGCQWVSPLLSPADGKCQSMGYDIRANEMGDAFMLAKYGSIGSTDATTFLGETFTGAEYGEGNSYNPNLLFVKVDTLGQPLWTLHSTEGDFYGGAYCPTHDGGAVLAVKFRHTVKNQQDDVESPYMTLVDAGGKTYSLSAIYKDVNYYHWTLVRVDASGVITQMTPLWTSHAVPPKGEKNASDVADIAAIVEDEVGDIYLIGGQVMDIALGTDTVRARENTEWSGSSVTENCNTFVVKTDAAFRYMAHTTTRGGVVCDRLSLADYKDGHIVVAGYAKADSTAMLQWGEQQVAVNERCIITARVDTALQCSYLVATQQVRINNMSAMFEQLVWKDEYLYLSGALMGGLVVKGDTLRGCSDGQGKRNDGMLLQIDAATGVVEQAALQHGAALNINIGAVTYKDTVYVLNYQFGSIVLVGYDEHLQACDTAVLATGGGMSTATGIAQQGNHFWVGTRAKGGQEFRIGNATLTPSSLWYATLSGWTMTSSTNTGVEDMPVVTSETRKMIVGGRLYIVRDGVRYDVWGRKR